MCSRVVTLFSALLCLYPTVRVALRERKWLAGMHMPVCMFTMWLTVVMLSSASALMASRMLGCSVAISSESSSFKVRSGTSLLLFLHRPTVGYCHLVSAPGRRCC